MQRETNRVSLNVSYPVEILPYHLRAKGLTIVSLSVSLSLFFGQYVNPVGIQNLGWKFYIVYEVWLVIEVREKLVVGLLLFMANNHLVAYRRLFRLCRDSGLDPGGNVGHV